MENKTLNKINTFTTIKSTTIEKLDHYRNVFDYLKSNFKSLKEEILTYNNDICKRNSSQLTSDKVSSQLTSDERFYNFPSLKSIQSNKSIKTIKNSKTNKPPINSVKTMKPSKSVSLFKLGSRPFNTINNTINKKYSNDNDKNVQNKLIHKEIQNDKHSVYKKLFEKVDIKLNIDNLLKNDLTDTPKVNATNDYRTRNYLSRKPSGVFDPIKLDDYHTKTGRTSIYSKMTNVISKNSISSTVKYNGIFKQKKNKKSLNIDKSVSEDKLLAQFSICGYKFVCSK